MIKIVKIYTSWFIVPFLSLCACNDGLGSTIVSNVDQYADFEKCWQIKSAKFGKFEAFIAISKFGKGIVSGIPVSVRCRFSKDLVDKDLAVSAIGLTDFPAISNDKRRILGGQFRSNMATDLIFTNDRVIRVNGYADVKENYKGYKLVLIPRIIDVVEDELIRPNVLYENLIGSKL